MFVVTCFFLLTLVSALNTTAAEGDVPSSEKIKVLIVTGGHDYDRNAWPAFLAQFPELIIDNAIVPRDQKLLVPGLEKKYDVVLLYDQDNTKLTAKQKEDFVALFERGIGVFALHHHLSAHQAWDEHFDLIGGRDFWQKQVNMFRGKEYPRSTFVDDQDIDIQIADPTHPITAGVGNFVIKDEAYGKCPVHPDVHVILSSKHPKATPQVAWTWKYGKSPVFVNMLGHGPEAWNQPEFGRIFIQAIRWLKANRPPRTVDTSSRLKPGVILSFDDRGNIPGWVAALPLFEKYKVKATFFINAPAGVTPTERDGLKRLMAAGHAIGSHGVNHADSVKCIQQNGIKGFLAKEIVPADQALRKLGANPVSFAWPNGYCSEETDRVIAPLYRHARGAKRTFPKEGSMADEDRFFTPVGQTEGRVTFPGHGLDNVTQQELDAHIFPSLKRAKDRGELLTVYAHAITQSGKGLSVRLDILEKIFARAQELGLVFYLFDDIP